MRKGRAVLPVLLSCAMTVAILVFGMIGMADAGSVKISVAEFTSDGNNTSGDYFKSFANGTLSGTASDPCLIVAVKIPATATMITKLIVYLKDTGGGTVAPFFRLTGVKPTDGTTTSYANTTVTATAAVQAIVVPLLTKAITPGQNIALGLCLDAGQTFYGAKVNYQ